jgi:hypothetical protein
MNKLSLLANKLNVRQRLLASACLFSLPLGVLFYFNIAQLAEKIEFAREELSGDRFQSPAIGLLGALWEYRIASVAEPGGASAAEARRKADDLIQQLEAADRELGGQAGFHRYRVEGSGPGES